MVKKLLIGLIALCTLGAIVYQVTRPKIDFNPTVQRSQLFGTWSDSDESLTLSEDGTYVYLRNGMRYEGTWGSENERLLLVPHLHRLGLYTRVVTVDGELRVLSTFQDSKHWDGSLGLSRAQ